MTSATVNGVTTTYTYRPDNLREKKIVNGVTTRHVWDMGNIAMDLDGNYGIVGEYTRGVGLIDCYIPGQGDMFYFHNRHGDVTQVVNDYMMTGTSYDYDAYGNQTEITATDTNPFRYSGEYYDYETRFIYLRNRYYDTTTGRFTTEDLVRDGLNWYSYCAGNPLKYLDPSGMVIRIIEPYDKARQMLVEMQKLTDNKLMLSDAYTDENGIVYYNVYEKSTKKADKPTGTALVSELINTEHFVDVQYYTSEDSSRTSEGFTRKDNTNAYLPGVGSGSLIRISGKTEKILVENPNGMTHYEEADVAIILGHEMIHALRNAKGEAYNPETYYREHTYKSPLWGWNQTVIVPVEEIETIGLKSSGTKWKITENALRRELGYLPRVRY